MNIIELWELVSSFIQTLWNTIRGIGAIFNSIFNFVVSFFSIFFTMVQEFYRLSPFITVPITAIGVTLIVALILSIIKKLPIM